MSISALSSSLSNPIKDHPGQAIAAGVVGLIVGQIANKVVSFVAENYATQAGFVTGVLAAGVTLYKLLQNNNRPVQKPPTPLTDYQQIDQLVQQGLSHQDGYYRLKNFDKTKKLNTSFTDNLETLVTKGHISQKEAYSAYQTYRIARNDQEAFKKALSCMVDNNLLSRAVANSLTTRQETRHLSNTTYALESGKLRKQAHVLKLKDMDIGFVENPERDTQTWMASITTGEMTRDLVQRGYKPAMLDMANDTHAGGGFLEGVTAQEEKEFEGCNGYEGVEELQNKGLYPIPEFGVFVLPNTTFFRNSSGNIQHPFQATIIGSAAYICQGAKSNRPLDDATYEENTKEKMRAFFKAAILNGNDSVVLSAFGCGAFGNDPETIARLYQQVLPEFQGHFKVAAFAVVNDQRGKRNAEAFRKAFGDQAGAL